MVEMEFLIFQKSSLQIGLALISLSIYSFCCGLTASPNLIRAKCSILGFALIEINNYGLSNSINNRALSLLSLKIKHCHLDSLTIHQPRSLQQLQFIFESMSQVADSMLFRQKLYEMFKESGLQNKLKTTLRTSLLQKLQKPNQIAITKPEEDKTKPFHLRRKFIESIVAQFLKISGKEYSLSIFMAQCDLQEEDCLRYGELSQILNLGKPSDGESLLFRLIEEFGKIRCQQARQRSTQTDFQEPLSKKLQIVEKEYKSKIDYWKLLPNSSITKNQQVLDVQQRLKNQFAVEKDRLKRQLQVSLKQQIEKKVENQYSFRLRQAQKQHQGRLNELKLREKAILDGLERKKKELEQKSRSLSEEQQKMINKYESRMLNLQADYRKRMKELQEKQKDFWKKELELRAKKREYEETIRLVKQKVIIQAGNQ